MLKIRRLHLSCVGNRNARFSPVSIDATSGADPVNTAIFLENGGGKTTLGAFLFLTLFPEQNQFLLKKAKDSNVRVAGYLLPGQTAYSILECETRASGLLDQPIRRVIGQVLVRQDASDKSPLKRQFFTFLPRPGLAFDDLPVHGIGGREKSHGLDDFRKWLDNSATDHPGAELWRGDDVAKWTTKLKEIHAEPELVRVQIDLNKREGGIDDHFKEQCADSRRFVHTLLDLALDSPPAAETARVLGKFLTDFQEITHLEDETAFCEEYKTALTAVTTAHGGWLSADRKLRTLRKRGSGLWHRINAKIADLEQKRSNHEEEIRAAKVVAAGLVNELKNAQNHVNSYRLEYLELKAAEAAALSTAADSAYEAARENDQIAKLAIHFADTVRLERDLEIQRTALRQKQAALEPLLASLSAVGAALHLRLQHRADDLSKQAEEARCEVARLQATIEELDERRRQIAGEQSRAEAELDRISRFWEQRKYQRDLLVGRGLIEANERGEDARKRWQALSDRTEGEIEEHESRRDAAERSERNIRDELSIAEGALASAKAALQAVESHLAEAHALRSEIAEHDLILAHFGDAYEPMRQGACEEVALKRKECLHFMLNAALDRASLERNKTGIEEHRVLPPPRDVEEVLRELRGCGISAELGLKYLADTSSIDEAQRLIRANPSRFAGIVIDPGHWDKLITATLPVVTQPVEISRFPTSLNGAEHEERFVVLPERGAFDQAAASHRLVHLDQEITSAEARRAALEKRYASYTDLIQKIASLETRFGDGKWQELERTVQARQRDVEALQRRGTDLRSQIAEQEQLRGLAITAAADSRKTFKETITPAIRAVDEFVSKFDASVEETRKLEVAATERCATLSAEDAKAAEAHAITLAASSSEQERAFRGAEDLSNVHQELAGIHYRSDEPNSEALSLPLADVRSRYDADRKFYEGQQDAEAQAQISADEKLLEGKRRAYHKQLPLNMGAHVESRAKDAEHDEGVLLDQAATAASRLEAAVNTRARRKVESDSAKSDHQRAERDAPESGKRRFPEGQIRPKTSAEASALLDQGEMIRDEKDACSKEKAAALEGLSTRLRELQAEIDRYDGPRGRLEQFKEQEPVAVNLPDDFGELKHAISELLANEKAVTQETGHLLERLNDEMGQARSIPRAARFTEKEVHLAKKFELYTDQALLADIVQILFDLNQRISSNTDRVQGLNEARNQLIKMMDGIANAVIALLRSIDKVSRLPSEGMGAWNDKPFIRISMHIPDEEERELGLRGLLAEIIERRRSPTGRQHDTDAQGLVRLIADHLICDKKIKVQILKPTPVRSESYEDVEMLRHYSGGEGVTVAILMYLTIVQLRAQSAHGSRRLQDAGFLLLDNPFGKCNREDLVRMQVQLAEQLRVQLIVMTGLNDPVILMSYPKRVRLVNDQVNRVTGANHVRLATDEEAKISSMENFRRFEFSSA